VPVPAPVVAVAPARARLTLFQSAEAKVFWPLAEEAVELSMGAISRAGQGPPQQKVRAMDSATQAVWESEHWLVSPPVGPTWVEAPRRVAATED
jgi:hypothetical protein